jgi:hypothetical protein
VHASTMDPHHSNITTVQPLAVDTGMTQHTAGKEPAVHNHSMSPPTPNQCGQYSQRQAGESSLAGRHFTVYTQSPSLSVSSCHTDCSTDFTCV